jgi:hypothetical protein
MKVMPIPSSRTLWGMLLDAWADLGSDLKGFQQNPQNIGPPGKLEGNAAHKVHNAVSLEITYGGLQY